MVGVFGLELVSVTTILAFVVGLVLGLLIGIVVPVEYRQWRETRSNRNRRIIERILQPLYDEVSSAAGGDLPRDGRDYRSYWETLDSHQRLHVNDTLQNELTDYSEKLKRLNLLDSELSDIKNIRKTLPYGMIETRVTGNDSTTLVKTPSGANWEFELPIEEFLLEYGSLIINSMSAEEMHRNLSGTDLEPFVAAWDEEYPGWEASFWKAFHTEGDDLVDVAKERQHLLHSEIPDHATRIQNLLEKRLKSRRGSAITM